MSKRYLYSLAVVEKCGFGWVEWLLLPGSEGETRPSEAHRCMATWRERDACGSWVTPGKRREVDDKNAVNLCLN